MNERTNQQNNNKKEKEEKKPRIAVNLNLKIYLVAFCIIYHEMWNVKRNYEKESGPVPREAESEWRWDDEENGEQI